MGGKGSQLERSTIRTRTSESSDSSESVCKRKAFQYLWTTFSVFRTGVHHSLSPAEVPGRDGGLLHPVLCEGHHRAVDHASEWYEVSAGPREFITVL